MPRADVFTMEDMSLSYEEVYESIVGLNKNKGAGPNDIANAFLIRIAESISSPIHILFMKSLLSGSFPEKWKSLQMFIKRSKRST